MNLWISNTAGKKDAVLTLALVGFIVVMVKLILSGASIAVNGNTYTLGTIGAAEIAAVLTPTLGAYVSRRYTDAKFDAENV